MLLCAKEINALRPKVKRYSVSDGEGLILDITPNGSMSWIFKYRLNGRPDKVLVGSYPTISLKATRENRKILAGEVAKGNSPAEKRRQKKAKTKAEAAQAKELSMHEFGQRYLTEQVDKNWKDPSNERRYIEKDFCTEFGERPLKSITAEDVRTLVYRKRDGGHTKSAFKLRCAIKRMFDYAVEQRLVEINPAVQVATKYVGKAVRRKRYLPPREVREYLTVIYQNNKASVQAGAAHPAAYLGP